VFLSFVLCNRRCSSLSFCPREFIPIASDASTCDIHAIITSISVDDFRVLECRWWAGKSRTFLDQSECPSIIIARKIVPS
jgi:hypothetical protein